ncbi:MAG: hypothetical protein ACKVPX_14940 [Myxococcaceae bacterium]
MPAFAVAVVVVTLSQMCIGDDERVRRKNESLTLERERQADQEHWRVLEHERENRAREDDELRSAQERDQQAQR